MRLGRPELEGTFAGLRHVIAYGHEHPAQLLEILEAASGLRTLSIQCWSQQVEPMVSEDLDKLSACAELEQLQITDVALKDTKFLEALPGLQRLRMRRATLPVQLELAEHPNLASVRIDGVGVAEVRFVSMPQLTDAHVTSSTLRRGVFANTPRLSRCLLDGTYDLESIDFAASSIRDYGALDVVLYDRDKTEIIPPADSGNTASRQ